MVLLEAVRAFEGSTIVCGARVTDATPFVRGGRLASLVLLEHMAQTMAAWYTLSPREGSVDDGYVAAVPELCLSVPHVHTGDALEVEAVRKWDDGRLGEFACTVRRDGEEVARAKLLVVRRTVTPENDPR